MIVWDGIGPVLSFLVVTTPARVAEAMEEGALKLQAHAQQNAPWSDRTGAARAGLYASVSSDMGEIVIDVGHTVDYGYWLELIQDGAFAIIMPTIEELGPEIIEEAGGKVLMGAGVTF